jgi:hypothetical protein
MTKKTATPRTPRQKKTPAAPPAISAHDIAVRAFEHYCARGGQPGGELDDWLRAERELIASLVASKPRRARGQDSHT